MKRFLCTVVILLGLVFAHLAYPVRINTIYQGEVPVVSQSMPDRIKALPAALNQVLVKVSGDSHVLDHTHLQSHLADAHVLMQEFGYSTEENKMHLVARFNSEGVERLLSDESIPIWGVNRPVVLAWVIVEEPFAADIIASSTTSDARTHMTKKALQRGLPIIFPMMDLTDLNAVSANDIATMAVTNLQNASKRYASDAILIARLSPKGDVFSMQAQLTSGADQWNWNETRQTAAELYDILIDNVTDALAKRYATIVTHTVQETVFLQVKDVVQEEDLTQLMKYIEYFPLVASVEVKQITGTDVTLMIDLHGTRESLLKILAQNHRFIPVSLPVENSMLVYQWSR